MTKRKLILIPFFIFLITITSCDYDISTLNQKGDKFLIEVDKDTLIFGSPINFGNAEVGVNESIEIDVNSFKTYKQLVDRIEELVCNDSIPYFKIESDSTFKLIYTINPCWDLYACMLIYQRNVMTIKNDSLITYFEKTKKLDSLPRLLKSQIQNFGQSEYHADNFKKLIFIMMQDSLNADEFINNLDYISSIYYKETERTDLHLRIDRLFELVEHPDLLIDSIKKENTP